MTAEYGALCHEHVEEGVPILVLERKYGDLTLQLPMVDKPVRIATSQLIAYCRDLQLPVSEFGLTANDMMTAGMA